MIKVSEAVYEWIQRSPFLVEVLNQGLINYSALARKMIPDLSKRLGKEVGEGAVVMALRRLPATPWQASERQLRQFFKRISDVSVRSNLLAYTYRNSETLLEKQGQLLQWIGGYPNLFYTFSQGITETTVLISSVFSEEVERIFEYERLLDRSSSLSSLSLMLPEENRQIYGVYYYILRELAWRGINIVELISTSHEFTTIVEDKDLEKTFKVLMQLRTTAW